MTQSAMMTMMTTSEAAAELGITQRRVTALIRAGRLPAKRFGRAHMIERSAIESVRIRKPGNPNRSTIAK